MAKKSANVVIVSLCKSEEILIGCLHTLSKVDKDKIVKVVVILSAEEEVRTEFKKQMLNSCIKDFPVTYVESDAGQSFAENCNLGTKHIEDGELLFLNDDTKVSPTFMDRPLEILEKDASVGIVGSKCLFPERTIQHAGIVFLARVGLQVCEHCFTKYEADHWLVNMEREFQAITGACMLIKESLWKSRADANVFNTKFVNGFEDLDLCFHAKHVFDLKTVYTGKSEIIHYEGLSRSYGDRDMKANVKTFLELWGKKLKIDYDTIFNPSYNLYKPS